MFFLPGVLLGIDAELAAAALMNFRSAGMRQKVVKFRKMTVIEDCYNASPDSMRAAFHTLVHQEGGGRKIAVVGDMLELGSLSGEAHRFVGQLAKEYALDKLFVVGDFSEEVRAGAEGVDCSVFPDNQSLAEELLRYIQPEDVILFKASRGVRLEEVLERLYEEY